jgi:hypothetical protein
MRKLYSITVLIAVLFTFCKSPAKLYDKGNYNDAMDAAIKKLQKDPGDYESREVLKSSYKYAVEERQDQIRILSNSSNETKYDQIFQQYNQLQGLYEKIRRYPAIVQFLKPVDYSADVETYSTKAFEAHLAKADKWMDGEDRRSYREAYYEFKKALSYKPDDFDTRKKLEDAYDAAVVKVMLVPTDAINSNYYYSNSSYQVRNFQDALMRNLNYNTGNDFIKYYTEWSTGSKQIQPDEIVEMRMGRMNIGQPYDQNSSRQVSKEVVVKEKVYGKDSVEKEYAKVYATITTTKRTLVSDVDMYVTAREQKGRILWSDNVRSEHQWKVEFASYTGDERALSDSDKTLLTKKDYKTPKEEDITNDLLTKLQNDVVYKLRNYYNRYQ